jgi:hypothetical protein
MQRSELMAAKYDNSIYIFGGKDDAGNPVEEVERFDIVTSVFNNFTDPVEYSLSQNFPNPFNPSTTIRFSLPNESNVQVTVYNAVGEEIALLINERMSQGVHQIRLEADKNLPLASGVYFYKLTAFNFSTQKTYIETRKMLFLK